MKYIFELILTTVIIFFVWNFLKRIFFTKIFKFPRPQERPRSTSQKSGKKLDSKINWDAETVEYEEVKESNEK